MSVLTAPEIIQLIETGVIVGTSPELVRGTSLDIRLGTEFLTEAPINDAGEPVHGREVYVAMNEPLALRKQEYRVGDSVLFKPGEFMLACSQETFNLPPTITAVMAMRSSMGRYGIDHANAGFCDPGWTNSRMTFELKSNLRFHTVALQVGMRIAQVYFFRHEAVPEMHCYSVTGRYNNDAGAQPAKRGT